MADNVGEFKVKIIGEVGTKEVEDGLESAAKKGGTKMESQLKKIFKSSSFTKFLEDTFNISEKIAGKIKPTTTTKPIGEPIAPSRWAISEETAGGAAATGGAKAGIMGGLMELAMKLSLAVAAIKLVYDAVMGLAPIQAILKILTAMIQITLYPILAFFLTIFKPILAILLRYFILPFFNIVMPILQNLDDWLKTGLTVVSDVIAVIFEPLKSTLEKIADFLSPKLEKITKESSESYNLKLTKIPALDFIIDSFIALGIRMAGVWSTIIDSIIAAMSTISSIIFSGWETNIGIVLVGIQNIINILVTNFTKLAARVSPILLEIIDKVHLTWKTISDYWERIKTEITDTLENLKISVSNIWNQIKDAVLGPLQTILNVVYSLAAGSVPHFAEGGIVTQPTIALIGEKGPEAIVPLSQRNNIGGGNITIQNTFNNTQVSSQRDIDDIVAKIERTFYTATKRAAGQR